MGDREEFAAAVLVAVGTPVRVTPLVRGGDILLLGVSSLVGSSSSVVVIGDRPWTPAETVECVADVVRRIAWEVMPVELAWLDWPRSRARSAAEVLGRIGAQEDGHG